MRRFVNLLLAALASCAAPRPCELTTRAESAVVTITHGEWAWCGAVATGPRELATVAHCLDGATRGGLLLRSEWAITRSWTLAECHPGAYEQMCTLHTDRALPVWVEWDEPVECDGAVLVSHWPERWSTLADVEARHVAGGGYALSVRGDRGASGGGLFCGDKLHSIVQGMYGNGQLVTQR